MKRALPTILGVILLSSLAPSVHAAVDMCVTIYENGFSGGDHMIRCDYNNALYNSTLVGDIAGLGGTPLCNTQYWPAAGNDWNDCASSYRVDGLPSGWRVRFYFDANYHGAIAACRATNGPFNFSSGSNDETTSWRVEPGAC